MVCTNDNQQYNIHEDVLTSLIPLEWIQPRMAGERCYDLFWAIALQQCMTFWGQNRSNVNSITTHLDRFQSECQPLVGLGYVRKCSDRGHLEMLSRI